MFTFQMPEVGEGVVEAEVAEWKVAVGDRIEVDQPLCEITTDKAQLEISSPKAGVVTKLHGAPGDMIKVHTPLVDIDTEGAAAVSNGAGAPMAKTEAPAPKAPSAPAPKAAAPTPASSETPARTKASPAVRRKARELGIDVDAVTGTGPGGRVTHDDLAAHTAPPAPAAPAPAAAKAEAPLPIAPPALPQVRPSGSEERIKIVGIRRKIAERMVAAKQTAPHYTYVEEVDCTALVELRQTLKPMAAARGVKLTYLPFFAKACSVAFRDFPNVNAWMLNDSNELVIKGDHHIGFATDTPTGLVVPVVRNVEQKSILHIAAELQDLFARARIGKCTREELTGSTFTITGVGSIGGVLATPILNLPEVGILGTNAIRKKVVVADDDSFVVRQMSYLSNSFDHRIIDGAEGARFTARLKQILEKPEALLLELV